MVDVPVDDRDPLEPELRLRVPRGDRDVVEEAEAHRAARQRMVSRRSHECEAALLGGLDRAARRQQGRFVAGRRRDGVGIQQRRRLDRLDLVDVRGLVAALYLLTRGGAALDDLEGPEQRLQARLRLDVRLRRVQLRELRMAYERHRHGPTDRLVISDGRASSAF